MTEDKSLPEIPEKRERFPNLKRQLQAYSRWIGIVLVAENDDNTTRRRQGEFD
jgi:hypothetical protein